MFDKKLIGSLASYNPLQNGANLQHMTRRRFLAGQLRPGGDEHDPPEGRDAAGQTTIAERKEGGRAEG